ncbi:MAG: NAD(P)-dependent alcohol dehydrogenase [Nocardioidaceae bacterium]
MLVEIGAAGVCRTDLHVIEGQWADKMGVALPYVIGHENAGWVREVGSAVTNVSPGDAVILHPLVTCGLCRACRAGDDVHCAHSEFPGMSRDGGMAEYMLTNARAVVRLDADLRPADVAALADAGLTAYHAVRKAAPLLYPGSVVVAIGAGGLGHIGIQCLAAMTTAQIIVVDLSDETLTFAGRLGADHTVRADGDPVSVVRDITDGLGAQVVIDFVGEQGAEHQGIAMLREAGSYFTVGYGGAINLPTIDIISQEINIIGNVVGSYNDLDELMALTAQGKVRLYTTSYPLTAANDALNDLGNGRVQGRGILVPKSG